MIVTQDRLPTVDEKHSFHPLLRAGAKIISYVFHPLFIPVYISWFLIYSNPLFPAFNAADKVILLIRFMVMYVLFPLVTVLLAKALGFVQSIHLKTQKDRIIPYVACGVYYFWMWYVLKNQPEMPRQMVMLSLAIFLASSLGLIVNSYIKVSMHAIAVGLMVTYVMIMGFLSPVNYGPFISVALLITGITCTARLITADHSPAEVYIGLFIGIITQVVAYWFL
jgi:hypothetical protein